jgi:hypothetical protein
MIGEIKMTKAERIALMFIIIVFVVIAAGLVRCPVQKKAKAQTTHPLKDKTIEFVGRSVLELLREYSTECYADSQQTQIGGITVWIESTGVGTVVDDGKEWIHREPTFTGFMAFLENKYGGGNGGR